MTDMTPIERTPRRPRTALDDVKVTVASDVERAFASAGLTGRKARMVDTYVETGNFTAAATASGYSVASVKRLIETDADVRRAIRAAIQRAATVTSITLERVLEEYARIAFSDMGEMLDMLQSSDDPDVALAELAKLPPEVTAAISEIQMSRKLSADGEYETGTFKVKFHPKQPALEGLAKTLRMYVERVEVSDQSSYSKRLQQALQHTGAANGETKS